MDIDRIYVQAQRIADLTSPEGREPGLFMWGAALRDSITQLVDAAGKSIADKAELKGHDFSASIEARERPGFRPPSPR